MISVRGLRTPHRLPCLLVALLLSPAHAALADTFSRGSVSIESRAFEPDDVEHTEDVSVALTSRLEIKYRPAPFALVARGLARLDALDDDRNIVSLEEAYGAFTAGPFTLRLGSQILNWSATEAFHPADVMNSRNFDSDLENLEKLGEPMVEAELQFLQGAISLYYMPFRIAPKQVPNSSRLSFVPRAFDLGDELWVDRDGKKSDEDFFPQAAVNLSQTIGPADISLQVIDSADRQQPSFTFDPVNQEVRPTYHSVTHVGLTYVQVIGGLIIKLEAARRNFYDVAPEESDDILDVTEVPDHEQLAGGLEYGWTTAGGHDATVIAEGQVVGLREDSATRRQLSPLQNDVLFAFRYAWNDLKSREFVAVFISDVERPYEYVVAGRYGQRLSDTWSISGTLRSLRIIDLDTTNEVEFMLTRNF